ncbi:hypothetical protein [Xanthomarina sp.]|uniref:hypothetical protein n=1 Tax=Xanthomarina sp. TaxID=1931211 RepID=UPI002BD7D6AE|nr:hypothetical protein [Xanthomarina sp.]HLV38609.1 hypothetical protein [Xanthomarina sp.]
MIQAKILFLQQELKRNPEKNKGLLETIDNLENLLNQIDLNAEVVPVQNVQKLNKLFESLKNEPLAKQEKLIIRQLVKY